MNIWAIVPVKPLRDSKSRLSHILSADRRADLTAAMLGHILKTLNDVRLINRTMVVSRDPGVLKIARKHDALTYGETDRQQDLNLALTRAAHIASAQEADCILILPADLPFLTVADVEMMITGANPKASPNGNGYYQKRTLAICTDHLQEGTNALLVCPPIGFTFQYGSQSFEKHLAEAEKLGMSQRIIHAPGIKFDLDTEEDWNTYQAMQPEALPAG